MARNNLQVINKTRSDRYNEEKKVEQKEEKIKTKKNKIKKENTENEEEKEFNPFLKKLIIFIIFIVGSFLTYSMLIEPNLLEVKEYKLETTKIEENFHGYKIVQISDINYGTSFTEKNLEKTIKKVNELKPDIVLFTGNLINKNITIDEKTEKKIIKILNKLETPLYKFAIYGSSDYNDTFEKIMYETSFKILDNESTLIYNKDETPIMITGFNNNKKEQDYTILSNPINEIDITNFYKIVLTHNPNVTDEIKKYNPDLILSGSTLGGYIDLEFTKPLLLDESVKYYEDYQKINKTNIYVSSGLGTEKVNMRFNNLPSINFYRLYKKTTS